MSPLPDIVCTCICTHKHVRMHMHMHTTATMRGDGVVCVFGRARLISLAYLCTAVVGWSIPCAGQSSRSGPQIMKGFRAGVAHAHMPHAEGCAMEVRPAEALVAAHGSSTWTQKRFAASSAR